VSQNDRKTAAMEAVLEVCAAKLRTGCFVVVIIISIDHRVEWRILSPFDPDVVTE
jgi:hypothetical protein